MKVRAATKAALDVVGAEEGFMLVGDDLDRNMFFHWVADDVSGTHYADVLKALPDRLSELGLEDETDAILGEVVGKYGAGN